MPILRTGIDLIEIERIQDAVQSHGKRFLERVFTPQELAEVRDNLPSLAGRFAAKEATAKALGTGIGDITWKEIEILRGPAREPNLYLHGAAKTLADSLHLTCWSISISHTQGLAIAFVAALGDL